MRGRTWRMALVVLCVASVAFARALPWPAVAAGAVLAAALSRRHTRLTRTAAWAIRRRCGVHLRSCRWPPGVLRPPSHPWERRTEALRRPPGVCRAVYHEVCARAERLRTAAAAATTKLAAVIRAVVRACIAVATVSVRACVAAAAALVFGGALHLRAGGLARCSSIAAHVGGGGGRAVNCLVILIATWCVAHRHCHTRVMSRPPARRHHRHAARARTRARACAPPPPPCCLWRLFVGGGRGRPG